MGFKSVMKKVGKVALKAAPIAAMFIPGVGPLASMAISAGTGALSKKLEGGSWKDAALAGGIGAATGALGGGAGSAAKGLAPSASVASKIGTVAKAVGKDALRDPLKYAGAAMGSQEPNIGTNMNNPNAMNMGAQTGGFAGNQAVPRAGGLGPSSPNAFADALRAGQKQAIRNQPFRKGYEVTTERNDPLDSTKMITSKVMMPKIYSGLGPSRRGSRAQAQAAY